jgi:bifunctional non-homologous end joining protein LigD
MAKRQRQRASQPPTGTDRFVVQRHRASSDHFDLRIERHGTLLSWAVPRGLTLDPAERRTAVRVGDHPLEYFDFEGVIPAGDYGAGDVIVWDWGTYQPVDDGGVMGGIGRGRLALRLDGERLRGTFDFERTGERGDRESWLISHRDDGFASTDWDPWTFETSVKSGRSPDEVRAQPHARWHSDVDAANARIGLAATPAELEALEGMDDAGAWDIGGETVRLTNLDKVLFPSGATKRDLIRHYATIAPAILPHLADRALNLHRYPDGVGPGRGFWQKDLPARTPTWVRTWSYHHENQAVSRYAVADRVATLAWLAQEAAVELHPWTSRTDDADRPTDALIDIDPGDSTTWDDVLTLARLFRTAVEHLSVIGFPKVTGRRGIQVSIPIEPIYTFEETRSWVETISRAIGETVPELVSWEWSKRARRGKARLDYTQNAINRTVVAPYSVRSSPNASVATPITWDELDDPDLRPDRWTIETIPDRLVEVGDLWSARLDHQQQLPSLS